jgi:DNA mismatch repair protein MutS
MTNKSFAYDKEIFVKDYFDIHNHYVKLFGKSTLILMQVGSFHEAYNTDTDGPDLFYLGERINMTVTQKNKSKELSTSNPRMMGFPSYIVEDMVDRIVGLGYTIIRIDQTTEPPNPRREVVGIFSPSTILSSTNNKYLISIVFDGLKIKTNNPILCIGLTAYDMSSGVGCVYETVSTTYDTMIALDNATRFLEKYPPAETIYHFTSQLDSFIKNNGSINRMSHDDILKYLRIDTDSMTCYNIPNINMVNNSKYQVQLIESIFKNNLDNINLHAYNYARTSLVGLLEFTKNHQPILLKKLSEPIYFDNENTLFLGNKALDQLDVLQTEGNNKPKTLFDIINNCNTPMGKRYLIDQLCNPLINVDELNNRYDNIDLLLEDKLFEKISKEMHNIYDLPKIIRKMELNKVYPLEIVHLINSIEQIINVFMTVKKTKLLGINKELIDKLKSIYDHINDTFEISYLENVSFANYKEESKNFIINNNYDNLDKLTFDINVCTNFMDNLVMTLEKFIEEQNSKVIKKDSNSITLKNNDRDGHYMLLTKRRCKILQEKLAKMDNFYVGSIKINVKDLEFKDLPTGNNTKITCKDIVKYSNEVSSLKAELATQIKAAFYNEINIIIDNYKDTLMEASNIVKMLDFLNSGAKCAYNLGYCKPTIEVADDSYFDATELRHPIVEVINTDTSYHPHNISLGKKNDSINDIINDSINNCGILLYGINSSGKSTLMRSIGLSIIMAQIGYYVPAKNFTYSPYKNLFTRIIGNDNIFRGMSSFMVEMIELMAILKRNNNNTLVIADEICRGTEEKSANIIVSYMLETLEKSNSSFITATHLHSVADLPSVKSIKGIKTMHISVSYDEVKDMLIYSRELKEGQGDKYYGVMVAKYMMRNDEFNIRTKELEYEYDNYHIKQSNYNKDVFMFECHICKSKNNLESHHINFQKDCDDVKVINKPHIKKNAKYNLVILCSKCHDKIDRNEIIVKGWIKTSNGIMLDY